MKNLNSALGRLLPLKEAKDKLERVVIVLQIGEACSQWLPLLFSGPPFFNPVGNCGKLHEIWNAKRGPESIYYFM